jgi:hypothetical protein
MGLGRLDGCEQARSVLSGVQTKSESEPAGFESGVRGDVMKKQSMTIVAIPRTAFAARFLGLWLLTVLVTTLLGASFAHADEGDDLSSGDPPSRVARLSYMQGGVYVQPADADTAAAESDDWIDAQLNRPLTTGDGLNTDSSSRAELQMGDANVQIEEQSRVYLLSLTDTRAQLQLDQGSINVYLRRNDGNRIDVITRNSRIVLDRAGNYRITTWDDDVTQIQVRDGRADVDGGRQTYPVRVNEQLTLRGVDRLSAEYDDLPGLDDFDRWAADRNDRPVSSSRYVSADVVGYEDLDGYGDWIYDSDYGYVWQPTRVVVGWAPYRYGHWVWVAPWGWTWIDDAPWGFAPFHYGRWTQVRNHWCWVPGPRTVRAVYAPALVAWVGTPSVSVPVNIGPSVGWIPLGPRDVYRPIYRGSDRYVRSVNLSNSRLSENQYKTEIRRQPHELHYNNRNAATVVSAQAFQQAKPVQHNIVTANPARLVVSGSAPDVRADRISRWGTDEKRTLPSLNRNTATSINTRVGNADRNRDERNDTSRVTGAGTPNDSGKDRRASERPQADAPDASTRVRSTVTSPMWRRENEARQETPAVSPSVKSTPVQQQTPDVIRRAQPDTGNDVRGVNRGWNRIEQNNDARSNQTITPSRNNPSSNNQSGNTVESPNRQLNRQPDRQVEQRAQPQQPQVQPRLQPRAPAQPVQRAQPAPAARSNPTADAPSNNKTNERWDPRRKRDGEDQAR